MDEVIADVRLTDDGDDEEPEEIIRYKNGYQPIIDFKTYEIVPGCYQKIQCPAMS